MDKRPPTAQQFVLSQLRRQIVTGELRPGKPIRQNALAEKLGVSRVPLREALKILEGEGRVIYEPHRGYNVAELSLDGLLEIYRIRHLLESEAARVAVERLTTEDLEQIVRAQEEVERAAEHGDLVRMTATNRDFHFALFNASGMPRLVRLTSLMWDATDAYRSIYYDNEHHRERVLNEHREIVSALQSRDIVRLLKVLDDHRENTVRAFREILAEESQATTDGS